MINAYRAELRRLTLRRTLLPTVAATVLYAVLVTWILISTASPTPDGMITVPGLEQAGGATRAVIVASTSSSVLVRALFIGMSAGDHARGTWRAALLQNPNRLQLAGGTFLARLSVMALLIVVLFAAGWITAFAVASGEGISTAAWLGGDAWPAAAGDLGKVLAYGVGWGLLGTAIGTVTRSVPIGLAIGVLWAGPVENVLGDDLEIAQRWFPGLLLRHVVTGAGDYTAWQIGGTLAAYAAVVLAVAGLVISRRDVTS